MKKEWFALLLLSGVILGSILNLRFLRGFTAELENRVTVACTEAEGGHWVQAEEQAAEAMARWTGSDKYTHVFIRHGEIDAVTDGFCTLIGAIRSRDPSTVYAARLALCSRLRGIYEMERLTPGSIL